jgi:hypothetical protein
LSSLEDKGAPNRAVALAARALAAVNVETFRRVKIKHAVRLKSFRAMRNFYVKAADAIRARPARPHGLHAKRPSTESAVRAAQRVALNSYRKFRQGLIGIVIGRKLDSPCGLPVSGVLFGIAWVYPSASRPERAEPTILLRAVGVNR